MIRRWTLLVTFCACVVVLLGHEGGVGRAESSGGEYVVVRTEGAARSSMTAGPGIEPSLHESGYRIIPVPAGQTAAEYAADLRATPGILSAEPDASVVAAVLPDDPLYAQYQASYLASIGAPAAWDLATGNESVIVAVLDTGTDLNHPDFAGRIWENTNETPGDGIDNDSNGCIDDRNGCRFINMNPERATFCGYNTSTPTGEVFDDHGKPGAQQHSHGTLVAGVLGAAGNNATGVSGMAWNVRIMTVKVLDCGLPSKSGQPGGDMSNVAQGIDYARRMGANIINLSLSSRSGDTSADLESLRTAILAAQDAGIIVVAAAGNHAVNDTAVAPGYPAAYTQFPAVVGVGAANNKAGNTWETYSNYGPGVDIAAPGQDIAGTTRTDRGGSSYGTEDGTSFAAPLVSGLFALMMSRNGRLAYQDYIDIVAATASASQPAPHEGNWAGNGIIDAGRAVARVPMTITGAALHDWRDVPAATPVRALIDGVECATGNTALIGGIARYALRVRTESEQAGCGIPGRVVVITIGGLTATTEFSWPGRNGNLAFSNRDITSVTPPPGGIVVQQLGAEWSFVAHLEGAGELPGVVAYIPDTWDEIAAWNTDSGGYDIYSQTLPAYVNTLASLDQYQTYWVTTAPGSVAMLNPNPGPRSVDLMPGWNSFVYTGPSKSVADALLPIAEKYTTLMQYDNTGSRWLRHIPGQPRSLNDFGGLLKLRVYWVYVTEPVTLHMD